MSEPSKEDVFDRLMSLPLVRVFRPFYKKHKEVLLYLVFGGFATLISIFSFAIAYDLFGINELLSNVISWVLAVLFAFFTNRLWVFHAPTNGSASFLKQMLSFFGGRLATLAVEEGLLFLFVTWLDLPALPVKIVAQVVVIILNYLISKYIVFARNRRSLDQP